MGFGAWVTKNVVKPKLEIQTRSQQDGKLFLEDNTRHNMPLAVGFDKSQCFARDAILSCLQDLDKPYEIVMGLFF